MSGHEHRRAARRRIARSVQIATGIGAPVWCRMKDISEIGARLVVRDGRFVPDVFLLFLKYNLKRWCQVVWRSKREVGVAFVRIPRSFEQAPGGQEAAAIPQWERPPRHVRTAE
jgi:hypothetical protein